MLVSTFKGAFSNVLLFILIDSLVIHGFNVFLSKGSAIFLLIDGRGNVAKGVVGVD